MKKSNLILVLAAFLPVLIASAQQNPLQRQGDRPRFNPLKNRGQQLGRPNIDLSVEPSVAPGEEYTVDEFLLKRKDLQGQVVELTFDRVIGLKQVGEGYTARVTFEDPRAGDGVMLLIPEAGFELFEEYVKSKDPLFRRRQTVLVEVLPANAVRAVGTRYSKNKPEGERYSW